MPADITQFQPGYGGQYDSSGNLKNLMDFIDSTNGLEVYQAKQSYISSLLTFQSGATGTGNGTAQDVSGYDVLSLQVTLSATAAVTFEATVDGTTWSALQGYTPTALGQQSSTVGTSGIYRFIVTGIKLFRARISSYTSGTIDVTGYAAKGSFQIPYLTNSYGNADAQSATSLLQGTGSYLLGYNGSTWDRVRFEKTYKFQEYLTLPVNTTFTVWTPVSTKKIRIMGISVSVSAACALNVRVGTAGSGSRIACLRFSGAGNQTIDFGNGYLATNATTDVLEINNPASNPTSATTDVHVTAWGTEE